MAITWSAVVHEEMHSGDAQLLQRAVSQAWELDSFIQSFVRAVVDAGQWPGFPDEWGKGWVYDPIETRRGYGVRKVRVTIEGGWGVVDHVQNSVKVDHVVGQNRGVIHFSSTNEPAAIIAAPDFHARMDAVDRLKDWVPLELLGTLRELGVAVPD